MSFPPVRDAPLPPGSAPQAAGIESAVAELKAALARDPEGFTTDAKAKEILDRLNDEIARVYGDADGDEESEGDYDDEEDDEGSYDEDEEDEEGEDDEEGNVGDRHAGEGDRREFAGDGGAEDGSAGRREPRVELPRGPRPYDLWRAAHEVDRPAKEKLVLTGGEWSALVSRLNESSRKKQGYLLRAQHQQIASELAGLTFAPHISEKSRELAAQNKSLPQRVEALMRKKKAKLDRIRHDRVEEELREATFRPNLTQTKHARAARLVAERRRVGHLLQYEMDKRLRAAQRRQLISEMEGRELTFNPAINRNSIRIVERLNRERSMQASGLDASGLSGEAGRAEGDGGGALPSSRVAAAKKALTAALAAGLSLPTAAQVSGLPAPDPRMLRSLGRSYLPGHEEETFHPKINPRSAALNASRAAAAAGGPLRDASAAGGSGEEAGRDVYDRLYTAVTASRSTKLRDTTQSKSPRRPLSAALGASGIGAGAAAGAEGSAAAQRDAAGHPVDEHGEPLPGHPHFFNVVAWEGSGRMDFILRRLVPASTLAAAAAAAAGGGSSGGAE